jgi:thioredoxin-related protein
MVTFDGKKMTERDLAKALNVSSYPTMWILSPEGERLRYVPGYKAPGELMDILDYVSSGGMARGDDYVEFLKTNKR